VTGPVDSTETGLEAPVPIEFPLEPTGRGRRAMDRLRAALEVFLCSGIPTQLFVSGLLLAAHVRPLKDGQLDATWVSLVTLGDTLLVLGLAGLLIRSHGESPRELFFGSRPALVEAVFGVLLVVPLLMGVGFVVLWLRHSLPGLHNVAENPFSAMLQSRVEAVAFAVVALVGGAVREEVQRAFLLTRFERHLGGPVVGLVVTSLAFGAGHWVQGWDSSVAIGLLGAVWGFIYLRRRSVVAPMVSHAGFNSFEIVQFLIAGSV
jgi:membrane protease YdiL (CAAX protease family)